MAEVLLLSLMSGSLGVSALLYYQWWGWQEQLSQQRDEEEEQLTTYPSKEEQRQVSPKLGGWEFKILRSRRNQFHDPDVLRKVCQEEAQGGWILFEKLDDRRLRFKRPMALREKIKPTPTYDPYRSYYGSRFEWESWLSVILLMIMATLPAYLGYRLVILTQRATPLSSSAPSAPSRP